MSMTIDFSGKTVLVTGGGRGLGKDMALLFAECGARVMIAGRGVSYLEKTVSEINDLGAKGSYLACDVSKSDDVKALVTAAVEFGGGRLDVVVHAAGVQSIACASEAESREHGDHLVYRGERWRTCQSDILCVQGCGDKSDPECVQDGGTQWCACERDSSRDHLYGYVG